MFHFHIFLYIFPGSSRIINAIDYDRCADFCQVSIIVSFRVLHTNFKFKKKFSYRNLANWKYFSSCFIFVFLYSSTVILYGYLTTNDDIIHACNPLFAFALTSRYTFKSSMLILSLLTLIIYIVMIRIFKNKNKSRNKDSIKIMRRLQLSVVIFVFTWLVSQALAMVFLHDDGSIHWEKIVFVHNVRHVAFKRQFKTLKYYLQSFFIVLSYSNTFYVTMWKSGEYRKNFRSVWGLNRKVIVASRNTMNLS